MKPARLPGGQEPAALFQHPQSFFGALEIDQEEVLNGLHIAARRPAAWITDAVTGPRRLRRAHRQAAQLRVQGLAECPQGPEGRGGARRKPDQIFAHAQRLTSPIAVGIQHPQEIPGNGHEDG